MSIVLVNLDTSKLGLRYIVTIKKSEENRFLFVSSIQILKFLPFIFLEKTVPISTTSCIQ